MVLLVTKPTPFYLSKYHTRAEVEQCVMEQVNAHSSW